MNVAPLEPDLPLGVAPPADADGAAFARALDVAGGFLDRAASAERAFAARRGGLVEMVVERASADVMLALATSAAQRTAQALSTIFGMQV